MKAHALRLLPGQDLKAELDMLTRVQSWQAACIVSGVGSLSSARIRYAGDEAYTDLTGSLEIVSISGTLSPDGSHIHLSVGDHRGEMRGGHLGEGAVVRTTAEIVLAVLEGWEFSRELDEDTGYRELRIRGRDDRGTGGNR